MDGGRGSVSNARVSFTPTYRVNGQDSPILGRGILIPIDGGGQ